MFELLRPALVITRREVRDQLRDWRIIFPVIGLTLFFPFLMNFTAQQILGFVQKYGADIIGERLVPFLLMIVGFFPISVSLVIALESFVGEKERSSIEPLLNAPLLDWQLYLGKLLAATVPPLLSSYLGMTVYMTGLFITHVPMPDAWLLLQIILLTTVQAVMMVSGAVVVSSQATSVRAANLLASFIIIPVALLIQGESVVMFWGNGTTLWWAVLGIMLLTILLIRVGLAHFRREELLGREIDVLNIRWMLRLFKSEFKGNARSIIEWYRFELPRTLKQMQLPIYMCVGLAAAAILIGLSQVSRFNVPLERIQMENLQGRLQNMINGWPLFAPGPVLAIWWQNIRAMLIALILGTFSLGVLGSVPLVASVGVAGYLLGLLNLNGVPIGSYLAFILPHGIIEIPAVILGTAAVIRTGAILATPVPDRTVGEVWISALADWTKVLLGIVIPLLFLAACIEVWVTPRLALWLIY
jgi:uncharacterized membrane protein SpoIIM required for sporulation/ABC-type transport system involved in multi-copper enzyme maturation permease subunit